MIDANLADLHEKGVEMPISPFLGANFYDLGAKAVTTAYVVGRVKIFDQDAHQLAFTHPTSTGRCGSQGSTAICAR
jgi:hypothetical protein